MRPQCQLSQEAADRGAGEEEDGEKEVYVVSDCGRGAVEKRGNHQGFLVWCAGHGFWRKGDVDEESAVSERGVSKQMWCSITFVALSYARAFAFSLSSVARLDVVPTALW